MTSRRSFRGSNGTPPRVSSRTLARHRSTPFVALVHGAVGVALAGLAACSRPSPAQNPDGSSASLAAEGSNAAHASAALSTRFAGVMPRGLTTVGAATLGDALYLVGGYFGVPHVA